MAFNVELVSLTMNSPPCTVIGRTAPVMKGFLLSAMSKVRWALSHFQPLGVCKTESLDQRALLSKLTMLHKKILSFLKSIWATRAPLVG